MKTSMNFLSRLCVAFLLVASVACSKQLMETEREADAIASDSEQDEAGLEPSEPDAPADPEPEPKPSKYKPEELITVTFSADAEATKTTLGGDTGRSIFWQDGDQVVFVWGPDEEDRTIGTADDISPDGKRATFTVDKVYAEAKTVYAVYPAGAFSSFTELGTYETDGSGTVAVSIGAMADGTRLDGSFGQADVCIARSSLETHKMKFKHLVAFVTVNASNKATKNVSLNGGSVAIGGILPVTVDVGDDGYTQTPVRGALTTTETTVTVGAAGVDGSTKTWIPVVAGFSFADGVALSYLDGSDGVIGQATLKKATSVDLGAELTFPSTINEKFSKDYYVTVSGAGNKDGSSWANAWDFAGMKTYVEDNTKYEDGLTADAPINIHIAAGTYSCSSILSPKPKYTSSAKTAYRKLNLIGGYPSSPTADSTPDPFNASNETIFQPTSPGTYNHICRVGVVGHYSIYGLIFQNHRAEGTGRTAVYCGTGNPGFSGDLCSYHCEVASCTFRYNRNTGVGAGLALNTDRTNVGDILYEVKDCLFQENVAGGGSGLNIDGAGNFVTVKNCTFRDNRTVHYSYNQDGGAGMKIGKGSALIEGCTFTGNRIDKDFVDTDTDPAYAADKYAAIAGNGAAMWLSDETPGGDYTITVNDCTFDGNYTNSSVSKGGAVFVQRYGTVEFNRCTFTGNECKGTASTSYAGAMMVGVKNDGSQNYTANNIDLTLKDCVFDANAVAYDRDAAKTLCGYGGAIFLTQSSGTVALTMQDCEMKNHANSKVIGNCIYAKSGTLALTRCKIHGNITGKTGSDSGNALYVDDATCTLTNTEIYENSSKDGGTVFLSTGCTKDFSMTGGKICDNTCAAGGTAVRVSSSNIDLTFTGVEISDNTSTGGYSGGVAIYQNTDATFTGCKFYRNSSPTTYAGAVYVSGEDGEQNLVIFDNCEFKANYSGFEGGAIYIGNRGNTANANTLSSVTSYYCCQSKLTVRNNCVFEGNYTCDGSGGAIAIATSGPVSISGSTFTGNYTGYTSSNWYNSGGAISVAYGQFSSAAGTQADPKVVEGVVQKPVKLTADIENCTFTDNHCPGGADYNYSYGGAIALMHGTRLVNQATCDRTKVALNHALLRIHQCTFVHNYANQGGALGVYATSTSDVYVNNSLFYRNYISLRNGSTIARWPPENVMMAGLHINNSTITNSWALGGYNRNYINVGSGDFTFSNSTIIGVPQSAEGVEDTSDGAALFRFDAVSHPERFHFINSIICSTNSSSGRSMVAYKIAVTFANTYPTSNARGFMTNKVSPFSTSGMTITLPGTSGATSTTAYAIQGHFPNLSFTLGSPIRYDNTYWYWTGEPIGKKSQLVNMNGDLANSAPDFYTWLQSKESVSSDKSSGKDQRNHDRSVSTYPGAYND